MAPTHVFSSVLGVEMSSRQTWGLGFIRWRSNRPPPLSAEKPKSIFIRLFKPPEYALFPSQQTRDGDHGPHDPQTPLDMPEPPIHSFCPLVEQENPPHERNPYPGTALV